MTIYFIWLETYVVLVISGIRRVNNAKVSIIKKITIFLYPKKLELKFWFKRVIFVIIILKLLPLLLIGLLFNALSWRITIIISECKPGFLGPNCTQRCPYPYYGHKYQGHCDCDRHKSHVSTGCTTWTIGYLLYSWTSNRYWETLITRLKIMYLTVICSFIYIYF